MITNFKLFEKIYGNISEINIDVIIDNIDIIVNLKFKWDFVDRLFTFNYNKDFCVFQCDGDSKLQYKIKEPKYIRYVKCFWFKFPFRNSYIYEESQKRSKLRIFYEKLLSYEFQKNYIEKHEPLDLLKIEEKLPGFINKEIRKDFAYIFEGEGMGFFELKN